MRNESGTPIQVLNAQFRFASEITRFRTNPQQARFCGKRVTAGSHTDHAGGAEAAERQPRSAEEADRADALQGHFNLHEPPVVEERSQKTQRHDRQSLIRVPY